MAALRLRRARQNAALLLIVYLLLYRACQAARLTIDHGRSLPRQAPRRRPRPQIARSVRTGERFDEIRPKVHGLDAGDQRASVYD